MNAVAQAHADLMDHWWAVMRVSDVGMPPESQVIGAFSEHLRAQGSDAGTRGKLFARDVVEFSGDALSESKSIEIPVAGSGDNPRATVLDANLGSMVSAFLSLVPSELQRESGKISLTYFRYDDQVYVGPHQDQFGDIVAIWALARTSGGGANFLKAHDWSEVLSEELPAGNILLFRDEMFWHGFTQLAPGGSRDVLVFIRLKDNG